jgi:type III secretion protein J
VLEARGISGDKVEAEGRTVTWTVVVPDTDGRDALRILVANKLPRQRSAGLAQVYPAGGGGLIPTKSEEKAKFLMAIQGEIEKKLKSLPGVVQAHVSIVQPDKDIVRDLDSPPPSSTASIAIVYNAVDDRGTAAVTVDDIRLLVASSVEELKPANVQVVMKKNTPATLVDVAIESAQVDAPVMASENVLGIKVADKKSGFKAKALLGIFGGVALVGLALGVAGIVGRMNLKSKLQKQEAEMTSMRKRAGMG